MRRDASGRRTLLSIEERGDRLRAVGRDFGIAGAAGMSLTLLRDEIAAAFRAQIDMEEREAMRQRHMRLRGGSAA
jgi:hypothetical protein